MLNNKTLLKILSILIALGMWIMVVSGPGGFSIFNISTLGVLLF